MGRLENLERFPANQTLNKVFAGMFVNLNYLPMDSMHPTQGIVKMSKGFKISL